MYRVKYKQIIVGNLLWNLEIYVVTEHWAQAQGKNYKGFHENGGLCVEIAKRQKKVKAQTEIPLKVYGVTWKLLSNTNQFDSFEVQKICIDKWNWNGKSF